MVWPAAALAALLFGFLIAYGSVVQSRLEATFGHTGDDAERDGSGSHDASG